MLQILLLVAEEVLAAAELVLVQITGKVSLVLPILVAVVAVVTMRGREPWAAQE